MMTRLQVAAAEQAPPPDDRYEDDEDEGDETAEQVEERPARRPPRRRSDAPPRKRSVPAKTSGSRCDTKMQETPRSRSARIWAKSRCASASVNAAVGSSRMSRRALRESARAITTIC